MTKKDSFMDIGNQILFFLAGLGVFNGFLLALYFFFVVKPKRWVNILFGLMMLVLCIRIGKSVFYAFTDVAKIYRQIGLSVCILVGPLLYLYIQHFLSKTRKQKTSDWMHLLIPLVAITLIGTIWPYETNNDAWNYTIVKGIYAVWLIYVIRSSAMVAPLIKKTVKKQASLTEQWIVLVYACMSLLCIAYILAYYGFPYLAGPLLFSLVFYVLIGFLISKKNRNLILYQEPLKYQKQKVSENKADELLHRLSERMQSEQVYLNHKVKLPQVATLVDATPHEVSQVINDRLGISFNHYINEFRVKAACQMLESSDHLTVEGIGREVGFNSRSAFYTAFKAVTSQTPAQYKAQLKAS